MQSLFTALNQNRTFDLSPWYYLLVCGEVTSSDNIPVRPILTKYLLNSFATLSGLVTVLLCTNEKLPRNMIMSCHVVAIYRRAKLGQIKGGL